ncbi:hypothetical protein FA893_04235 [Photobacterium damselae subsp. piscicida]|uniref:hypothetical protein n=1 Tax=Photobacterium damselae TaxID=38293 RepID=UPI0011024440|nr:hypothetical protein [Photobacterium damselae]TFZ50203.1 hypothetical protein E4T25_17160 [Photobacterium damselae subsp. piscicida]TJZ97052.1 hypothetical protein FA893_04235 [Photobacterium damselae subsp. piscicida]
MSIANALYLDGLYVPEKVTELVIDGAIKSGLISKGYNQSDNLVQWVIKTTEHHLLILNLQDCAKENPFIPTSMACLDKYVKAQARLVCKALAAMLIIYTLKCESSSFYFEALTMQS